MERASDLVRSARHEAGLSVRALAERAYVPPSTVSRIENRQMDPTLGMLRKLLDAAGQVLTLQREKRAEGLGPALVKLHDAWTPSTVGDRPDWTRLRAFLDHLRIHPECVRSAIAQRPRRSGSVMMDALLAGVAEKLADDAGVSRPSWVKDSPRLSEEWTTPGTPKMQEAMRSKAPPQLLDRGLVIDAGSLWREPLMIGA